MRIALLVAVAVSSQLVACTQKADAPEAKTDEDKALYAMGVMLSQNIVPFELTDEEMVQVRAGFTDGAKDASKLDEKALEATLPKIRELQEARAKATADREKAAGPEAVTKAAAESGAVKTESGMVYQQLTEGSGESPTESDVVRVHYEGKFAGSGKVFDTSKGNDPVTFPLNAVIPCWTEGVQKMKVGGSARLTCPPDLAYGEQGQPPRMPGGATLVFDVELLEIVKEPAAPAAE